MEMRFARSQNAQNRLASGKRLAWSSYLSSTADKRTCTSESVLESGEVELGNMVVVTFALRTSFAPSAIPLYTPLIDVLVQSSKIKRPPVCILEMVPPGRRGFQTALKPRKR